MGYKNKFGMLGIAVLCLTLSALFGIAYAAFTKTIKVSGSASVSKTEWKVFFAELNCWQCDTSISQPTISQDGLTISGVSLIANSDTEFSGVDFYLVNDGDFDARISSISFKNPSCTKTLNGTNSDETTICSNINQVLWNNDTNSAFSVGDVIPKHTDIYATYVLDYGPGLSPSADVQISNLGVTITVVQNS